MERFTKGPWVVQKNSADSIEVSLKNNSYCWSGDSENYLCIGISSGANRHSDPCNNEESIANANLIAAAPEMYEMLRKLSGMMTDINAHVVVNEVEKLLAKARGE